MKPFLIFCGLCLTIGVYGQEGVNSGLCLTIGVYGQEGVTEQSHACVDLGLPSGTKWAVSNLGTDDVWKCGRYYAWGETAPKDTFTWSSYKYCEGSAISLLKYSTHITYGVADSLTVLTPADDAATVNWGDEWCMPTSEQFRELQKFCTWQWTPNYRGTGVAGNLGVSKMNGDAIFFPAAGYRGAGRSYSVGDYGDYWTADLDVNSCESALDFSFVSGSFNSYGNSRYIGQTIRAVRK